VAYMAAYWVKDGDETYYVHGRCIPYLDSHKQTSGDSRMIIGLNSMADDPESAFTWCRACKLDVWPVMLVT
jgi:hypothetical protein